MIERVTFTHEAEGDLAEAYESYVHQEPGLGELFLENIETCLHSMLRRPHMFPIMVDEFRGALVMRFPCQIFFEQVDDVIVIHSVLRVDR